MTQEVARNSFGLLGHSTHFHSRNYDCGHKVQYFAFPDWCSLELHHQRPTGEYALYPVLALLKHVTCSCQAFGWLVRQMAEVENDFNSVERIVSGLVFSRARRNNGDSLGLLCQRARTRAFS